MVLLPRPDGGGQLLDRGGLVAGGRELGRDAERGHGAQSRASRRHARVLHAAGGDDPIEERAGLLLFRLGEDLGRRPFLQDLALMRKQTRFAISRAKPISCVAMIIVIPWPASSRIWSSTSATSTGSSALVTSSSRRMSGCIASARTIATRCCCPPESGPDTRRLVVEPEPLEQRHRRARRHRRFRTVTSPGRERDVAEHVHVREQVERLEDDADSPARRVDVDARGRDLLALDRDCACVDRLEQVDTPQKRRLARPAGADQADDLVRVDGQIDPLSAPRGRRRTCGVLDVDALRHTRPVRLPLALVPRDQPVHEPRLRDRDRDEDHGQSDQGVKLKSPCWMICACGQALDHARARTRAPSPSAAR